MKKVFIIFFSFLVVENIFSYTYLGKDYGNPVLFYGATETGLGGAGVTSSKWNSIFYNPALSSFYLLKGLAVNFAYLGMDEKIATPSELARFNSKAYFDINSFSFYYSFKEKLSLFFGYSPLYDFNYENENTTYLDGNKVTSYIISNKGSINSASLGFSFNFRIFNLGFSYLLNNGDLNLKYVEDDFQNSTTKTEVNDISLKGNSFRIGLFAPISENFFIGLNYNTKIDMTGEKNYSVSGTTIALQNKNSDYELDYPSEISFGIKRDFGESNIQFEIKKKYWKNINSSFRDVMSMHLGMEYIIGYSLKLRYGFFWVPYYKISSVDIVGISFGCNWKIYSNFELNLGIAFTKRNYEGDGVYFLTTQRIDETTRHLILGINWSFE